VSYLDILLGDSRLIIRIFCLASHCELFCWVTHGELCRYSSDFSGEFSPYSFGDSRWYFSLRCRVSLGELHVYFLKHLNGFSRYIVGRFAMNFPTTLSPVWRWIIKIFSPAFQDELCGYSVRYLTAFSRRTVTNSRWIFSLWYRVRHGELCTFFWSVIWHRIFSACCRAIHC